MIFFFTAKLVVQLARWWRLEIKATSISFYVQMKGKRWTSIFARQSALRFVLSCPA